MTYLHVNTAVLGSQLPTTLDTAADELHAATDTVPGEWSLSWNTVNSADGTGLPHYAQLWVSHGVVCHENNDAADAAEHERGAAGAALAAAAAQLATQLRRAAQTYDAADEVAAAAIEGQLR